MFFAIRDDGPRSITGPLGRIIRGKTYRTLDKDKIVRIKRDRRFMEVENPNGGGFDRDPDAVVDNTASAPKKKGGVKINAKGSFQEEDGDKVQRIPDRSDLPALPDGTFESKDKAIKFAEDNDLMGTIEEMDGVSAFDKRLATKRLDKIVREAYKRRYGATDDAIEVAGSHEEADVVELNT